MVYGRMCVVCRVRVCRVHVCMNSQVWIVTVFKVHMFLYVGGVARELYDV